MSDRGYTAIIYLVAALWSIQMVISMFSGQPVDPLVHGIFTIVISGVFTLRTKDSKGDK